MTKEIDFNADIINVRDLIERFEELESESEEIAANAETDDDNPAWGEVAEAQAAALAEWENREEFEAITAILTELAGRGGDEQWRRSWYPLMLIRDDYFTDYAMELLEDIGDLPRDLPHYIVIDEEKTAENIKIDYSTIDIYDTEYYYR